MYLLVRAIREGLRFFIMIEARMYCNPNKRRTDLEAAREIVGIASYHLLALCLSRLVGLGLWKRDVADP